MGMSTIRQSTPPNHVQAVTGPRQSARIRTPLARPGFIQTHADSRRALSLAPASPGARTQVSVLSDSVNQSVSENQSESVAADSSVPGQPVVVNLEQDSDDENAKVKAPKNVKGGFDNPKLYFFPGGAAPGQTKGLTYKCRWCPKSVRVPLSTISNLKTHRDGSITSTGLRKACPGRLGAINAGAKLPISADDEDSAIQSKKNATGTLNAFVQKGRFDNKTMNKILVLWLIRHSLAWNRFEDHLLRVAFDYSNATSSIFCRTWAALHARKLYVTLQEQVIRDIRKSDSKISLVADVWTTKGNHKAFIGLSVCYINQNWEYVLQHLALKYVSWHHNGRYLAAPLANVLIKHGFQNQIRSNNFTMAKEMAAIIRRKNGDFEHYRENHPRCFCHVLALILGAGLKSLKLKNQIQAPASSTKPSYFPALEMIAEGKEDDEETHADNEIQEIMESDDGDEIDPDDASEGCISEEEQECTSKETNSANETSGKTTKRGYVEGGIGHTLAKVEYICRRVCSSTAKRAEFQLIAKNMPYTGPHLIAGYGIRWNVAYDSWQRAYSAKKVITQLLTDESDKYAGKSAAGHFFKGYEVSNKEWEDVNSLNKVLAEFLATTLRMEGDGTTSSMVLYEYFRLINFLETKKRSPECLVLVPMFDPMINIAKKYRNLALQCDATLLATVLHPAWRLSLIKDKFPEYSDVAEGLLDEAFKVKSEAHLKMNPTATTSQSNDVESEDDEFNYYPEKTGPSQDADELRKYKEGAWPLSKKSDPLSWWRVSLKSADFAPADQTH
ncbi:hypothetical protein KEM48_008438 [Puccinia striiformis f. sp. tritici PST-130]|nr:hypothetical protein KEM48_008438 [Puccinia striiformis f. sp. tritici PST-130]